MKEQASGREWNLAAVAILAVLAASTVYAPAQGDQINRFVLFGNGQGRPSETAFRSGNIMALFGANRIDLSDSSMEGSRAEIQASAFFGKVDIRVPRSWEVRVQGSPVLGRYADYTHSEPAESAGRVLVVKGQAVFGEVSVHN